MGLKILPTAIPDVKVIMAPRHQDPRGFFSETYNKRVWAQAGLDLDFVQDNHALSVEAGVVRGLHYQVSPFAQDKLVRVLRGAVFDVAVDLRKSSPTLGKHVAVILTAVEGNQVLIPKGFAHGYCTLEPNSEVFYKVTGYYSPESERGVLWNDSELGIKWPVRLDQAVLSGRDKLFPPLRDLRDFFG